jgi:hypothetical protein
VRIVCLGLLIASLLSAPLLAQAPTVGGIEFYGLHKFSGPKLLHALHLKTGDPLPPSKGDLEDELEAVAGVVMAHVEAVCCEDGKTILFIGIEEKGAPHLAFRSEPSGSATLPDDVVDKYQKFLEAVREAAHRGSTAEDLTNGHSLMADPDARGLQEHFVDFAGVHLLLLREVLSDSSDAEQRAMAATIIGYAANKRDVVGNLELALQDPDEAVRANALRSLNAIAVLARLQPKLGLHIEPTWLVEMLNSNMLSDRNRAADALVTLTTPDGTGAGALSQIRDRALDAVVEMAQWKELRYALPPFILVGRLAGMNEQEIQKAWTSGDRQTAIGLALASREKKPVMGPVR